MSRVSQPPEAVESRAALRPAGSAGGLAASAPSRTAAPQRPCPSGLRPTAAASGKEALGMRFENPFWASRFTGSRLPPSEPSGQAEPFRRPTAIPLDPPSLSAARSPYGFAFGQNNLEPSCRRNNELRSPLRSRAPCSLIPHPSSLIHGWGRVGSGQGMVPRVLEKVGRNWRH